MNYDKSCSVCDTKGLFPLDLVNEELLETLHEISEYFTSEEFSDAIDIPTIIKGYTSDVYDDDHEKTEIECLSERYLDHLVKHPENHIGYPEGISGLDVRPSNTKQFMSKCKKWGLLDKSGKMWWKTLEKQKVWNKTLMGLLGAKHDALFTRYFKNGYIGWHNNQNAYGHNLILSYSPSGSGYFEYMVHGTKDRYRIDDLAGVWTAKAGYFGGLHEKERLCWHKAETGDDIRITVSFIVPDHTLWKFMCEDIETP
jgi:hypothetical protein